MCKDLDNHHSSELVKTICRLDFIDFEKACDLLANYIDFFAVLYDQMPYAFSEFTPTYEAARQLLEELLNDQKNSMKFKYIALDYIKNMYYQNNEEALQTKIIKFRK